MKRRPVVQFVFFTIAIIVVESCASNPGPPPSVLSTTTTTANGTTISDEMIGRSKGVLQLSEKSLDARYGFSEQAPVMIGGGFGKGSERVYKYLNALRAPSGEPITYARVGTCCPFKSANSPFGGEALLEVYKITVPGAPPKNLYFNWYDEGPVLVPVGLSAAK